jgi:hypothetical protein
MKTILIAALSAFALASVAQNVDVPFNMTLTNNLGEVFTNVQIVNYDATKLYYTVPGDTGGGSIDLSNLPPPMQNLFHYNPTNAAVAALSKSMADARFENQQAAARRALLYQQRNALIREKIVAEGFQLPMTVIHKMNDGLLVNVAPAKPEGTNQVMFLMDYPTNAVDDQPINVMAYQYGEYTYKNAMNAEKTVLRLTCDLNKAVWLEIYRANQASPVPGVVH